MDHQGTLAEEAAEEPALAEEPEVGPADRIQAGAESELLQVLLDVDQRESSHTAAQHRLHLNLAAVHTQVPTPRQTPSQDC